MVYNKTTWANGDVITADKLNNIEDGISNLKQLIVTFDYDENDQLIANKTFAEVYQHLENGGTVACLWDDNIILCQGYDDEAIWFINELEELIFYNNENVEQNTFQCTFIGFNITVSHGDWHINMSYQDILNLVEDMHIVIGSLGGYLNYYFSGMDANGSLIFTSPVQYGYDSELGKTTATVSILKIQNNNEISHQTIILKEDY